MIDQTRLPLEEVFIECGDYLCVADAIKTMKVRGAPAIGVSAAMGVALGAQNISSMDKAEFLRQFDQICETIGSTRPTAVNLFWAINRMKNILEENKDLDLSSIKKALIEEVILIASEDEEICRKMGENGSVLIEDGDNILTHCNAGALAAVSYGTALAVIRAAFSQGKKIHVYVDETRPLLQGARLTAWELMKENIPMTLITDNMAGYFMSKNKVDKVVVGADRIAANGDVANKIGTYSVSVLAKENNIPFYVAAPLSTIDFNIKSGDEIIIEERSPEEVTHIQGKQIAPTGVKVANPAFDVTPAKNIAGIITEKGIAKFPYTESLVNVRRKT